MNTKKFSFEGSIAEIEQIIEKIDRNELGIDEVFEKVKHAMDLLNRCNEILYKHEAAVKQLFASQEKAE